MSIWFYKDISLEKVNKINNKNVLKLLGITIIEIDDNSMTAEMEVTSNTHQPFGILHGGVSCVLAESVGSIASNWCIDQEKYHAVGLEINANHLRPMVKGKLKAIAAPLHLGRKTHVWDIKLKNDDNKLVCISRLTTSVIDVKNS